MSYRDFLETKVPTAPEVGFDVARGDLNPALFAWQKQLVQWALLRGRAALFARVGLGKTLMQLDWARVIHERTGGDVLILAPLAVAHQTQREGEKFGIPVTVAREPRDLQSGINVTNYERLEKFDTTQFTGIVLDESSILKGFGSKTRWQLNEAFADTPYKLCCTATPAPNQHTELGTHAHFLGIMDHGEMLTRWFGNDTKLARNLHLKKHGEKDFWRWVATWAACVMRPSDLRDEYGRLYSDEGFDLPPLTVHEHSVAVDHLATQEDTGQLFRPVSSIAATELHAELRRTIPERVARAAGLVSREPDEPWLVWCNTNREADALMELLKPLGAVEVRGNDRPDEKERKLLGFATGDVAILITKPSIAGFGLNYQHCARHVFVGLSYCYSEDTEVLTREGWRTFDKVSKNIELATVNQETLAFEWQQPTEVIWESYAGEMVRFYGPNSFDLLVTPNHNMFVKRCEKRYGGDSGRWHLKEADELAEGFKRQEYRMLSAPKFFEGDKARKVAIPVPSDMRINSRSRVVESIEVCDLARLAGWFLSEGYVHLRDTRGRAGRISICQSERKPENRAEIIALLQRIGLTPNFKTKDIVSCSSNLAEFLVEQFGNSSHTKRIPGWVKDLDRSVLVVLRDTMLKGDGCHCDGVPRFYRTVSKALADDFQEICLKTGVRARVRHGVIKASFGVDGLVEIYDVQVSWKHTEPAVMNAPESVEYSGMIGCATVPNHTLIIRRNGVPLVSGNSFEQLHQALGRSHRFGQTREVEAHIITAETEQQVLDTIHRKQEEHTRMQEKLVIATRANDKSEVGRADVGKPTGRVEVGERGAWEMREGDCVEVVGGLPDDSVHLSLFSPPFSTLYSYSPSLRDMGNCADDEEFFEHFAHLVPELLRTTVPGRLCIVHTKDMVRYRNQYGFGGLRAFSDEVRAAFEDPAHIAAGGARWGFHSRVTVWKDPVREMQRTKSTGLLYKTLRKDSSQSRVGCPEYLMVFRKWTPDADSPEPIEHTREEFPLEVWQRYASPVWEDIRPTDVLNTAIAREAADEKHIAPLQLDLIARCLELWSNSGDLVLDPFCGLGSVGVKALETDRRFLGVELKNSYFERAVKNLTVGEYSAGVPNLLEAVPQP